MTLENELRALTDSFSEMTAENKRLKDEMNELSERIATLQEASWVECPLCGQPLSVDERAHLITTLKAEGVQKGDRYRANANISRTMEARRVEIVNTFKVFAQMETDLQSQQRTADQLADRLAQKEKDIALWQQDGANHLETVTEMLATKNYAVEAHAELAKIDRELEALGYNAAAHDDVRRAEQAGRESEAALRRLEQARAAIIPLEREIADLENQYRELELEYNRQHSDLRSAEEKYQNDLELLPDVNKCENELFSIIEAENQVRLRVGSAMQKVENLKAMRARKQEYAARREGVIAKIARLKVLEKAFGKDGIPALLIEQALPDLEIQANEILDRLSSGAMSVRFATQKDYKDIKREDKKETLDILISDAAGSREYEMFSGGEAFRVNFAIRLALSRVLAKRAGARLQTLVIDEGFGSQDVDGRQRLVETINLVRSDFEKVLVITHLEELKDAFPARIEVEKTFAGSELRLIT